MTSKHDGMLKSQDTERKDMLGGQSLDGGVGVIASVQSSTIPSRWISPWTIANITGLILITLGCQYYWGAYSASLASHSDEPAHFITGMLVYDYLKTGLGTPPLAFAESYYLHYPKVAFGHWPPVFYAVQAMWYAIVGPSVASAFLLIGITTALISICMYSWLARAYGKGLALFVEVFFLTLPLVQIGMTNFMSDMQVVLFSMLAILSFGNFLRSNKLRHILAFGAWSSLAILTKGNAMFLALFPLLAVLTTGKYRVLWSWKFWTAAGIVLVLCGPYYALTTKMSLDIDGHVNYTFIPNLGLRLQQVPSQFIYVLGIGLALLALAGASSPWWSTTQTKSTQDKHFDTRISIAWVASVFLFLLFSPIVGEKRLWLPALPGVMFLVAAALQLARQALPARWRWTSLPVVAALLLTLVLADRVNIRLVAGFRAMAEEISKLPGAQVILISSDAVGEGTYIVEQRLCDPNRSRYVLRGSKVLADDSWSGRNYKVRFQTEEEIRNYLMQTPVHLIVIDNPKCRGQLPDGHHEILIRTLERWPDEFVLLQKFPVQKGNEQFPEGILLYENRLARGKTPEVIEVDLSRMLGRQLRVTAPQK